MSGFLASNEYNVCTENEISVILSHFNSDYIFNIIHDIINNRFNFNQINSSNIVTSFEQNFKQLNLIYTSDEDKEKIIITRENTYKTIIQIICKEYNLYFNEESVQDYYSIAYYLYDLLVSKFTDNMILFFTNFIIREKNNIYDSLNLNNYKKSKDTSTIYNKKVYKNMKLAIINANLEYVLNNVCCYDISFDTILNNIYQDKNMIRFLQNSISPINDFFTMSYKPLINSNAKPIILTNIRLEIHKQSMNDNLNISNI